MIAHAYSMLSCTLHFRYDNLHKYDLPYPEAIFDVDFYRQNPMPFVTLSQEIWPGVKYRYDEISYLYVNNMWLDVEPHIFSLYCRPTLTHCFFSLLDKKGILQRVYVSGNTLFCCQLCFVLKVSH